MNLEVSYELENFYACCWDLRPFPSTVGGMRDLTQLRKIIDISELNTDES